MNFTPLSIHLRPGNFQTVDRFDKSVTDLNAPKIRNLISVQRFGRFPESKIFLNQKEITFSLTGMNLIRCRS